MRLGLLPVAWCLLPVMLAGQTPDGPIIVLTPDRVYDGAVMHTGWSVLVRNQRIIGAGPGLETVAPPDARRIALSGMTLLPGLIEGHSHLLLHPYNETRWDDQVLHEPLALRVARAVNHAARTLEAGITTVRDLGHRGRRLRRRRSSARPSSRASFPVRACGRPRGRSSPPAAMARAASTPLATRPRARRKPAGRGADPGGARARSAHGADWIKVYADYRWGPARRGPADVHAGGARSRSSRRARSGGRPVAAHASTAEGMRRAVLAGVETIEHGDAGTPEVFRLMARKQRGALSHPGRGRGHRASIAGWKKGAIRSRAGITEKHASFKARARRRRARSASAATSACFRTATTCASSSSWWSTA